MSQTVSRIRRQGERRGEMSESRRTSIEEARPVGDAIGVDWSRFDLEQFRAGMDVEYEHGSPDPQTDVTGDDPIITRKIALAHMKEYPRLLRGARTAGARGRSRVVGQAHLTARPLPGSIYGFLRAALTATPVA